MKANFIVLFCLVVFSFSAQEIGTKNTNTVPATQVEELQDSTVNTILEKESTSKKPKAKKVSVDDMEAPVNKLDQDQDTQIKAASFYSIKANVASQSTQRSPSISQQQQLDNLVQEYKESNPNSFEYNYFSYLAGNHNVALINNLLEAKKLKPNNVDVQVQLAAYYFITKDQNNLIQSLEFLVKNKKIEQELFTYAEHLLESVEQNGTLITHGFDDTYSVLYLQYVKKKRKDVTLISLDFMQSAYYKTELNKAKFALPNTNTVDVNYFANFCSLNATKKLYVSMTLPKPYLEKVISNIQISGISFAYNNSVENLKESNTKFYKQFISSNTINQYASDKCKKLSSNYLPLLYSLKKEYTEGKELEKAKEVQAKIDRINVQSQVTKSVSSYK